MNNFGVNLTGKRAIYNQEKFYKPNTTKPTRTFICESGPGCDPKSPASRLGLTFSDRTITGRWESDNTRDTIDVNSLDAYFDAEGNEIKLKDTRETGTVQVMEAKAPGATKSDAKAKPAAGTVQPADEKKKEEKANVEKPATAKVWNADRVIELYKAGTRVSDIAVEMGYERGQGNNRVRGVLKAAGIYKEAK